MLNLFGNLFGRADEGHAELPEQLVKKLIERTMDGTDPRLRIVSGYAKTLRKPVIHAAECVIGLIDSLPQPLPLDPHASPALAAMLYSESQARQILSRAGPCRDLHNSEGEQATLQLVQLADNS